MSCNCSTPSFARGLWCLRGVVLPLLQAQLVLRGWLSNDAFLAGYGAAQAVPNLFTISAYFGAASSQSPNGWVGALVASWPYFCRGTSC